MSGQNIFPKNNKKEHFNLIIYEKHGRHFEIDVDPDKVIEYRNGNKMPIMEIIKVDNIYSDVRKALPSPEEDLKTVFGTISFDQIAVKMLDEGDLQLSQHYRKTVTENIFKRIVSDIHRLAVDARTDLPLPPQRILNALEEAKFKVKEGEHYDYLFKQALDDIKKIMPIKVSTLQYSVHFEFKFADRIIKFLENIGKVLKKDTHQTEMYVVVEIPSGLKQEFIEGLNSITHGSVKVDEMK